MAKEIERKFLLDKPTPWSLDEPKLIKQGYILLAKNKQLRIRITGNVAKICLKYTSKEERDEYEYEIPLMDGLEMMNKCRFKLEKLRKTIEPLDKSYIIDIDQYPNGLIVAEVEFKSLEDSKNFVPFEWFGEEITKNKLYSNIVLAKQRLHF